MASIVPRTMMNLLCRGLPPRICSPSVVARVNVLSFVLMVRSAVLSPMSGSLTRIGVAVGRGERDMHRVVSRQLRHRYHRRVVDRDQTDGNGIHRIGRYVAADVAQRQVVDADVDRGRRVNLRNRRA